MGTRLVRAVQLSVDCAIKVIINPQTGEEENLGFDFFVAENEVESSIIFIKSTLKELNIPLVKDVEVVGKMLLDEHDVYRKDNILTTIKNELENLKEPKKIR